MSEVSGITVQPGMNSYMELGLGACYIMVRNPDDLAAAARALELFSEDLYESDVFASLDGEFGEDDDGGLVRWTPPFATDIYLTADGPYFWFDDQSILEAYPEVIPVVLDRLIERLKETGVRQGEIGWPAGCYGDPGAEEYDDQ